MNLMGAMLACLLIRHRPEGEEEGVAVNRDKEPISVKHAELERMSDNSPYRSMCPACERGALMMRRNDETFELLAEDNCLYCAQKVIYEDIEDLRAKERK